MPFRDKCLRNIRVSETLLKKGAEAGLSLYHIGSLMYREGYEETNSVIENVIEKAREMYYTLNEHAKNFKVISPQKTANRSRAYSTNEDSNDIHNRNSPKNQSSPHNTETDTSDNAYDVVLTISELSESEEVDHDLSPINGVNRSMSLPPLKVQNSLKSINKKKIDKNEAFNQKLFYYIEAFMDQAIQKKIKDLRRNETPLGRIRSCSYAQS